MDRTALDNDITAFPPPPAALHYTFTNMNFRVSPPVAAFLAIVFALSGALAQTAPKVSSPKDVIGFNVGDDYQMASYTQLETHWKKLAAESDRMKLVTIGQTAEGRPHWPRD